jgi:hypothetical protein
MKLKAASRHLVEGMGLSLRMMARSVGGVLPLGCLRIGAAVNESGKVKRLDKGLAAVLRSSPARSH